MQRYGIEFEVVSKPELEAGFMPLQKFNEAFLSTANQEFGIALERNDGQVHRVITRVHGDDARAGADCYYLDRLLKTLLWQIGGFRVYLKGSPALTSKLAGAYSPGGAREFDAAFMGGIYGEKFEVLATDNLPEPFEITKSVGRHLNGCRIGFDAGGSDRKVSAVIDGEAVFSEEVVWHPKTQCDPGYHFNGIVSAFREAAKRMPRVDAIGISSAGIFANNRLLYAQLFQCVPKELFDEKARDIYARAVREIGAGIPFEVANDGDVTALAGSMSLERNNIFGIAMGTSMAGGYVNSAGKIQGWLNEAAFIPVDASPDATVDPWSGDIGLGVRYFCQEAVIRLAPAAGILLDSYETPAEKLSAVQALLSGGNEGAAAVFRSIGCFLGHSVPFYNSIYGAELILLLGRVMSGAGGDIILATANKVLTEEYPHVNVELMLPNEKMRRVGQSIAAASLPEFKECL